MSTRDGCCLLIRRSTRIFVAAMSFSPRFYDILFKGSFFFVGGLAGSMYATHHHHNNLKILKQDLNILHPPTIEFGAAEDKVSEVSTDPYVKEVLKYGNPGLLVFFPTRFRQIDTAARSDCGCASAEGVRRRV